MNAQTHALDLADALAAWRAATRTTQVDLAKRLTAELGETVTQSAVSRWERGALPDRPELTGVVSTVLGVDVPTARALLGGLKVSASSLPAWVLEPAAQRALQRRAEAHIQTDGPVTSDAAGGPLRASPYRDPDDELVNDVLILATKLAVRSGLDVKRPGDRGPFATGFGADLELLHDDRVVAALLIEPVLNLVDVDPRDFTGGWISTHTVAVSRYGVGTPLIVHVESFDAASVDEVASTAGAWGEELQTYGIVVTTDRDELEGAIWQAARDANARASS